MANNDEYIASRNVFVAAKYSQKCVSVIALRA